MGGKIHFIWGSPSLRKKRIQLLEVNGMKQIYVLSRNKKFHVKEKKEVTYLPAELQSFIKMDNSNIVHHFFLKLPKRPEDKEGE